MHTFKDMIASHTPKKHIELLALLRRDFREYFVARNPLPYDNPLPINVNPQLGFEAIATIMKCMKCQGEVVPECLLCMDCMMQDPEEMIVSIVAFVLQPNAHNRKQ